MAGNVPKDDLAYVDSLAFFLKLSPTIIAPSEVANPLASMLIPSKKMVLVRAEAPAESAPPKNVMPQKTISEENFMVNKIV